MRKPFVLTLTLCSAFPGTCLAVGGGVRTVRVLVSAIPPSGSAGTGAFSLGTQAGPPNPVNLSPTNSLSPGIGSTVFPIPTVNPLHGVSGLPIKTAGLSVTASAEEQDFVLYAAPAARILESLGHDIAASAISKGAVAIEQKLDQAYNNTGASSGERGDPVDASVLGNAQAIEAQLWNFMIGRLDHEGKTVPAENAAQTIRILGLPQDSVLKGIALTSLHADGKAIYHSLFSYSYPSQDGPKIGHVVCARGNGKAVFFFFGSSGRLMRSAELITTESDLRLIDAPLKLEFEREVSYWMSLYQDSHDGISRLGFRPNTASDSSSVPEFIRQGLRKYHGSVVARRAYNRTQGIRTWDDPKKYFKSAVLQTKNTRRKLGELKATENIFYPFGGIDIVNPLLLLDHAKNIYSLQLLPFGDVRKGFDLIERSGYKFGAGPNAYGVDTLLARQAQQGLSTHMMEQAAETAGGSLAPYILLEIQEVLGAEIVGVSYLIPDDSGQLREVKAENRLAGSGSPLHGKISFRYNGRLINYYLLYADVSDKPRDGMPNWGDVFSLLPRKSYSSMLAAIQTNNKFNLNNAFSTLLGHLNSSDHILLDTESENSEVFKNHKVTFQNLAQEFGYGRLVVLSAQPMVD